MRRTIYACRYLTDPDYRRKISRQLNKGESIHALKRDLIYAHEGAFRARHMEAQTEQAWCLTLATNAVIACTTEYYGLAVDQMRRQGRRIDADVLALPGSQREPQFLRRDRGRHRRRTRRARPDRVPATARARHVVLIAPDTVLIVGRPARSAGRRTGAGSSVGVRSGDVDAGGAQLGFDERGQPGRGRCLLFAVVGDELEPSPGRAFGAQLRSSD